MSGPLVEHRSRDTHTHTPSLRLWAKLCHEKPRYAALRHSAFKARRHEKNGAILTQWHARACRATICCRVRLLSTGRAMHILTRHPCDFEQNCATRSRATPRYAALHSGRGAMRKMGLFRPSGTRARVAPRYVVGRGHKVEGTCCRYRCAIPATASESCFEKPVLQCVQHRYARSRTCSVLVF